MITLPEREEYRKALKQLSDLHNTLDRAISRDIALDQGVAMAMEKMTGTTDIHNQFRALDSFYKQMDAQYDEKLRYAAQFRLSPFCEYMYRNEPPALHHEFLIDHLESVHNREIMRLAVSMPPGSAKALALDTPIPTPSGWTTMGELRVGDQVFDENGQPCNVSWVSPVWKNRPVYTVTTDCGDKIVADKDHEWLVCSCEKHEVYEIKETHELCNKHGKRVVIKRADALNTPKNSLPIHPHRLGLRFSREGSAGGYLTNIPMQYLRADKESRMELLRGLVDSAGIVCEKSGTTTLCSNNIILARQIQELVRTLGVKAVWSKSPEVCEVTYRVSFYLEGSAKLIRKKKLTHNQVHMHIDVEEAGVADTVCIEVTSPSHLFLCGKSMTPTHNSTYASLRFAAWHLGRRVDDRWLQGAHTQTFAKDRLGKPVRNMIASPRYREVFPDRVLSASSSAADYFEFANSNQSYYKAIGVGQGISGFRADVGAIDDPIASREDAESPTIRRKLHEWCEDDFGTRPMPGSPIFVVACVAGDTPVTLSNGSWKNMKDMTVGDKVASWGENGIVEETVTKVSSQGISRIFEIKTGNHTIRANAEHPFLVSTPEGNVWKKLWELSVGDLLVSGRNTQTRTSEISEEEAWVLGYMFGDGKITLDHKTQSYVTSIADCTAHPERVERVLKYLNERFGAKFKLNSRGYYRCEVANMGRYFVEWGMDVDVHNKRISSKIFEAPTNIGGAFLDGYAAADGYLIQTGKYRAQSITTCNKNLAQDVRHLARRVGRVSTNMYSRTGVGQPPNSPKPIKWERHDCRFHDAYRLEEKTTARIQSVIDTGQDEEVYDLTVTGSETFLVDGIVCHNTRWHEDDLIGHELAKMKSGTTAYPWEVINIPALAEDDDPLGREAGEGLWPEVFGTEWYLAKKLDSTPRSWNSLYQGKPSDEEGGVLKRSDIRRWKIPPRDLKRKDGSSFKKVIKRISLSVDCAEKATQRSDWTAATVWVETFDNKHYLIHAARCRKEFIQMSDWIDELARAFKVHQIMVEDKGAGTQYIQVQSERPAPAPVIPINTNNNSKMFRFDGVTPLFSSGRVFFPEQGVDWIADLEDELLKFPNAKNDDYVDSVSQYLSYSRRSNVKRGTRKVNSGMNT